MRGGSAQRCEPVTGALAAGAPVSTLSGRYALTLVATGGTQQGGIARGSLTLAARADSSAGPGPGGARTRFAGAMDMDLEAVGARRLGDISSPDPRAPGIAVYEQMSASGVPTVTARVGSVITAPPPPGLVQIEGAYTVLFVRRIGPDGFAGGWASGLEREEARGHFCAVRLR